MKPKLILAAVFVLLCIAAVYVWVSQDAPTVDSYAPVRGKPTRFGIGNHKHEKPMRAAMPTPLSPVLDDQIAKSITNQKVSAEAITDMKQTVKETAAVFDNVVND